ncbi:MAG: hypothetical protein ABI806_26515 [Candidatus Solibacter sp.]
MTPPPGRPSTPRIALFLFCVLLVCPLRYWGLGRDVDSTWRFALNYAAAHGLVGGRDVLFTYGPLGYLLFPEYTGHNLTYGLLFQGVLWVVLAGTLADLFFRAGLRVRNLGLFTLCLSLAAPLFWFNYAGGENLLLTGALILIVTFQLRGSTARYALALVLIGLLPLFKLTAGMVGFAALAGFVAARTVDGGRKALPLAMAAALIPATLSVGISLACLRDMSAFLSYLRGSAQLASGYSAAMSLTGTNLEFIAAAIALGALLLLLRMQASASRPMARFHSLMLAVPLFVSFKHGFVRQDVHVINYFCFVALAASLVALTVPLTRRAVPYLSLLALIPLTIWLDQVPAASVVPGIAEMTGLRSLHALVGAAPPSWLRERLAGTIENYPALQRLEPEIAGRIGNSSVTSLSIVYTNLAAAGLRVQIYPVVQRYSAYTVELDARNAAWVRDHGPRFLVFDGVVIDERDAWAETPAMWLEVYRWYDTSMLGTRNLLLERRAAARFGPLESLGRTVVKWPADLTLPAAPERLFWTLDCGLTTLGRVRQTLFRLPEVRLWFRSEGGQARNARVVMDVLRAPVLWNPPVTLAEFATRFQGGAGSRVVRLRFATAGAANYGDTCEVEFLRAKENPLATDEHR